MGTRTLMTAEEFAQMRTAEGEDFELVDGELIRLASAVPLHNKIRRRLERMMEDYFARNPVGELYDEIDCRLSGTVVRRPDLCVFLKNDGRLIDLGKTPIPFAPDIAVEVLSPSEVAMDVNRKVEEYLSGGSREIWVLDYENKQMFVHTNDSIRKVAGKSNMESALLPGFVVTVDVLVEL